MQFLGELCTTFLLMVGIGILLGGFFQAIHRVIEAERRPWEGWRR